MEGQTIGERIRAARMARNLTTEQLADMVYCHRTLIYRYEHDKYEPKFSTVVNIAKALNVPVSDLVDSGRISATQEPQFIGSVWNDMASTMGTVYNIPMFLTDPSGFILGSNAQFQKVTGFYHYKEELPYVNILSWLPYHSAIPKMGSAPAVIHGRSGENTETKIDFKVLNKTKDMPVPLIMGTFWNTTTQS